MNRWTICGLVALAVLSGCAPSLDERRDAAISDFQRGRLESAKAQLLQIVARYPMDSASLYCLGRIYHAEGQYEYAIYYYQTAVTADPSNEAARQWHNRAVSESDPTGSRLRFLPMPGDTVLQD